MSMAMAFLIHTHKSDMAYHAMLVINSAYIDDLFLFSAYASFNYKQLYELFKTLMLYTSG